ncbi:uncharacterized protein B0I36DRAFT_312309 [Microdochium trichocladiopsis]|uniref:Infection structure specific protein n=1 Tax=Microdochium trichocladiopsis TaxID=1682393 RepID=A0A9P8YJM8_9PEZI|nr:uncharacterized protein B0I36DRAFT_312309 [Microdochium trichocladiopsis]KAH7041182.1 hypothetical protein B0I36DRAFT_312309 [Microdochium trichocladiopsis]
MKTTFSTTVASFTTLLAASQAAASGMGGITALVARQTVEPTGPCATSAASIIVHALPAMDPVLFEYLSEYFATAATTGPPNCAITDTPSSVSSAYASFTNQMSSWSSAEYDAALSFVEGPCFVSDNDAAGEVAQLLTAVDAYLGKGCSSSGGAVPTPTPASSTTGGSSSSGGAAGATGPTTSTSTTAQPGAGAQVTQAPVIALAAGMVAAAAALV